LLDQYVDPSVDKVVGRWRESDLDATLLVRQLTDARTQPDTYIAYLTFVIDGRNTFQEVARFGQIKGHNESVPSKSISVSTSSLGNTNNQSSSK
jgi:hypothetical protein